MNLEEITLKLEERGVVWHGVAFALVGIATTMVLAIYSESDFLAIIALRLIATQLHWAFIPIIVIIVERIRKMFETRTQIRREATMKALAESRQEGEVRGEKRGIRIGEERGEVRGERRGERRTLERVRAELLEGGVELSPEIEKRIFGSNGHKS